MNEDTKIVLTDHGAMIVYVVVAERLGVSGAVRGDDKFWELLAANCTYGLALIDELDRQGVN